MGESLLVIINNAASRARRAWPLIRETLEKSGVPFDAHETTRAGDAEEQARAALRRGVRTIAAVGGDGTLSEVAAGFLEPCDAREDDGLPRAVNSSAALAVLPAGTGDDFARGLTGGVRAPLGVWVAKLVKRSREVEEHTGEADGTTRRVDLIYGTATGTLGTRPFICLNAATLGIGAEVAALVAAQRGALLRLSGEARFALAAIRALAAWRNRRARLRVDGEEWEECLTNLIAVANGPYAGGGMNFSPAAKIDDALLDVVTACGVSRAVIIREMARIHRGGHVANPKVRIVRGRRVRIETTDGDALRIEADGDVRGLTPVEFRLMPSALRVVR